MTRAKCIKWLDQLANTLDYDNDMVELTIINETTDCLRASFTPDEVKSVLAKKRDEIPGKEAFLPAEVYEALMNAVEDT